VFAASRLGSHADCMKISLFSVPLISSRFSFFMVHLTTTLSSSGSITSKGHMTDEKRVGKDFEGSGRGQIGTVSQHLSEGSDETTKTPMK
jgi:hypothetical protein